MMSKSLTIVAAGLLAGCAASTSFEAKQSDVSLHVKDEAAIALDQSNSTSFATTSFGQYEFKAEKPGAETFYGILPLHFNGGYLALDILFFAPAALFNLREVYPQYQFDLESKTVRYRENDDQPWASYTPNDQEAARAVQFFESGD